MSKIKGILDKSYIGESILHKVTSIEEMMSGRTFQDVNEKANQSTEKRSYLDEDVEPKQLGLLRSVKLLIGHLGKYLFALLGHDLSIRSQ